MIPFVRNDGGRAAAGYKGKAGDCVVRAIAIATELPYQTIYDGVREASRNEFGVRRKSTPRNGVHTRRDWFRDYMQGLGWYYTPTLPHLVHLEELPQGRLIVHLKRHYLAVIDGVAHDTHDPNKPVTIYSANYYEGRRVPKGVRQRDDGEWIREPKVGVHGYWREIGS